MKIQHNLTDLYLFPIDNSIGYIYYLFDKDNNLLYIGQTICLHSRMCIHRREKRIPFKFCRFFQCCRTNLDEIEAKEIIDHGPPYNRAPPKTERFFSLSTMKNFDSNIKGKMCKVRKIIKQKKINNFNGYYHIDDMKIISQSLRDGDYLCL